MNVEPNIAGENSISEVNLMVIDGSLSKLLVDSSEVNAVAASVDRISQVNTNPITPPMKVSHRFSQST